MIAEESYPAAFIDHTICKQLFHGLEACRFQVKTHAFIQAEEQVHVLNRLPTRSLQ